MKRHTVTWAKEADVIEAIQGRTLLVSSTLTPLKIWMVSRVSTMNDHMDVVGWFEITGKMNKCLAKYPDLLQAIEFYNTCEIPK